VREEEREVARDREKKGGREGGFRKWG